MKALSIVLSVIAAILIALIAVFFIGGVLGTEASVTVMEAAEDPVSIAAAAQAPAVNHLRYLQEHDDRDEIHDHGAVIKDLRIC